MDFSFISTMWDVKYLWDCGKTKRVDGFISTMWDVKVEEIAKRIEGAVGFISTMWDVKEFDEIKDKEILDVLSRLCGM